MITKEDIKNLANLARIEISAEEIDKATREIDSILDYVSQIEKMSSKDSGVEVPLLRNVMREDVVENQSGKYTEAVLKNAPSREKNYLKVKKIL